MDNLDRRLWHRPCTLCHPLPTLHVRVQVTARRPPAIARIHLQRRARNCLRTPRGQAKRLQRLNNADGRQTICPCLPGCPAPRAASRVLTDHPQYDGRTTPTRPRIVRNGSCGQGTYPQTRHTTSSGGSSTRRLHRAPSSRPRVRSLPAHSRHKARRRDPSRRRRRQTPPLRLRSRSLAGCRPSSSSRARTARSSTSTPRSTCTRRSSTSTASRCGRTTLAVRGSSAACADGKTT